MTTTPEKIIEIKAIINEFYGKLTPTGRFKAENGKEIKSDHIVEKSEPEEFTKEFLLRKFIELFELETLPEKIFEAMGHIRKCDYILKNKKDEKFLLEAKPLNANLFKDVNEGAVNQIKGLYDVHEVVQTYKYGIATDGIKWIFISDAKEVLEKFDIRKDFVKIFEIFNGIKEIISLNKEAEITKRFYNWYDALLHGGKYKDNDDKIRNIRKNDSLVENIYNVSKKEERKEIAQIIVNRLVFIKFIQKKGVIGFNLLNFLFNKDDMTIRYTIKELFFQVFNRKPEERHLNLDPKLRKIPFLNGSLFSRIPAEVKNPDYDIKAENIRSLIEFINSFKFLHEESSEYKVSLSPEILGFIFEKAMTREERKSSGSYYTPKDFTKYISEEVIYNYIIDESNIILKEKGYKPEELLSEKPDIFTKPNPPTLVEIFNKIIRDIKICDNACGSGAFLLSASEILFNIWKKIFSLTTLSEDDILIKKRILKNNIYGVDLNPNAIEIAKLRLWMWVTDSYSFESIEALPNIDFNLRFGNSLIGFGKLDPKKRNDIIDQQAKIELEDYMDLLKRYKDYRVTRLQLMKKHDTLKEIWNKNYVRLDKKRRIQFDLNSFDIIVSKLKNVKDPQETPVKVKISYSKDIPTNLSNWFNKIEKNRIYPKSLTLTFKNLKNIKIFLNTYSNFEKKSQLDANLKKITLGKNPTLSDLERNNAFHWFMEFPNVYLKENDGFDIFLGNPPFGSNALLDEEKKLIENEYEVFGCGDYCGYFIEREIQLAKKRAYLGNLMAEAFVVNNNMTNVRNYVRKNGSFNIAFFGSRPSKVFTDNEKRISMIIGKTEPKGKIRTTKNIRFVRDEREVLLENLEFQDVDGLILGNKIADETDLAEQETRLPKIGTKDIKSVLIKLKSISDKYGVISDNLVKKSNFSLQYRSSAGYWIHSLKRFPYKSSKVKTIYFNNEIQRDFCQTILNSSTFYLYWAVYGNNRDVPKGLIEAFPFPDLDQLEGKAIELRQLANEIDDKQKSVFDSTRGRVGEFRTIKIKDFIDQLDDFIGKVYGFSNSELEIIKTYDSHIREAED